MNNPISQKPNILQKILSSRFLLPIIFILLGLSALAITSPFAKADQAGITQIDCIGCVPSLMDQAAGVAVDANGNIFVVESNANRIQKLDSSGNSIIRWGKDGLSGSYGGSVSGGGNGEFNDPNAVATDTAGNVYVADRVNNRIQKFDSNGTFIAKWGSSDMGSYGGSVESGANAEFNRPFGIAVDSSNNIYIADSGNNRIQKLTSDGTFIAKWGSASIGPYGGSNTGGGNGEFATPRGIAVDSSDNIYVSDSENQRIQKFTSDGTFITKWGSSNVGPYGGSDSGNGNGEFSYPTGIDVDDLGNVYVVDYGNNRIQKFTSSGVYASKYVGGGNNSYPLIEAYGIHAAGSGKLYVGTAYSAMLTLCDNDVSLNGCVLGSSTPNSVIVPNAVNNKPVSISQTGCGAITNTGSTKSSFLPIQDSANSYPVGLINYTLTGCSSGGTSNVTATFAGVSSPKGLKLRKYNPTTQAYTNVSNATLSLTTLSGEPAVQANFTITDGSSLDQDGQANGVIVDPVGLAVVLGDSSTLANTGVIAISAGILSFILVLSISLIYIDYIKHKKPLHEVDPTVSYSFAHHMKVVTLPLFRYRIHIKIQKVMPNKNIRRF